MYLLIRIVQIVLTKKHAIVGMQYTDKMIISSLILQYELFKGYNYSANIFIMILKCIEFTASNLRLPRPMNDMFRQTAI